VASQSFAAATNDVSSSSQTRPKAVAREWGAPEASTVLSLLNSTALMR